jgi:hypothetical protein
MDHLAFLESHRGRSDGVPGARCDRPSAAVVDIPPRLSTHAGRAQFAAGSGLARSRFDCAGVTPAERCQAARSSFVDRSRSESRIFLGRSFGGVMVDGLVV